MSIKKSNAYLLVFVLFGLICFGLQAERAQAAITLAQNTGAGNASTGNTKSITLNNESSSDLNIVSIAFCSDVNCDASPNASMAIYDSNGNAYSLAVTTSTLDGTAGFQVATFYAPNIAGGTDTITASTTGSPYYLTVVASEWKGVATSNPLDQIGAASGSSTAPTVTTDASTTQSNELIYSLADSFSNSTDINTPTYVDIDADVNGGVSDAYLVSSTISHYTVNWTAGLSDPWWSLIATFKPVGAAPPPPPTEYWFSGVIQFLGTLIFH
jgi:hypothetical protein